MATVIFEGMKSKPRPKCPWYGFGKAGGSPCPLFMDTHGNQCPWHDFHDACPCEMEMRGETPDAAICELAVRGVLKLDLSSITVFADECNGHPTQADHWSDYVMSDKCPRPTIELR
ncbi:MAG: hypothetical protein WC451_03910 [Patescibacteria group bacterium]|jgi:hypothetical protein